MEQSPGVAANAKASVEAEPTAQKKGSSDEAATADGAEHVAQPEWVRWASEPLPEPHVVSKVSTSCMMARTRTLLCTQLLGALPGTTAAACPQTILTSRCNVISVYT